MTAVVADRVEYGTAITQAYQPSWVDRLTDRVKRLPIPAWLVYLAAAVALSFTRTAIAWLDGSYPAGSFFHIHILDGFTCIYLLAVLHYLDEIARTSMSEFRPVLNTDVAGYENLRYQLTTLPARSTLAWTAAGLILGLLYLPFFRSAQDLEQLKYFTSTIATIYDVAQTGLTWVINAVFAAHTIHQLRMVSRIYTMHTNVSIFDTGPLYALSRITAVTTLSMFVLTYVYLALYGNWQLGGVTNGVIAALFVAVALVTFVWPLLGARKLLRDEKERRYSVISHRIEAAANDLHKLVERSEYAGTGDINSALDGLIKEQRLVKKASTWPWDPEALRAVVTALLLPVAIWLITRLLERFGI